MPQKGLNGLAHPLLVPPHYNKSNNQPPMKQSPPIGVTGPKMRGPPSDNPASHETWSAELHSVHCLV